jgi:hypothetical protein
MKHAQRLLACFAIAVSAILCGPAAADFSFTHDGHSYLVVKQERAWLAAALDAAARQLAGASGYLTVIDSAAENQAIFTQISNPANILPGEYAATQAPDGGNGTYVWIGATDRIVEGDWIWEANGDAAGELFYRGEGRFGGTPIARRYNNWGFFSGAPWEPDNGAGGLQDAAGIGILNWPRGLAGQWNDIRADNTLFYIVEFDAVPEPSAILIALIGFVGMRIARTRKELWARR